jgi:arylsulfatase A-like enzyme
VLIVAGGLVRPEHIDIAALSLGLAGIDIPKYMQAKDILSDDYKKRSAIFAARDRCDETVEYLRAVRTDRYKYIRNFLDQRPHMQPNRYKDKKDIIIALRTAHEKGTLTEAQNRIFNPTRPKEELYDLKNDPHEIHNLADDPKQQKRLLKFRKQLENWMKRTHDHGPESETMYDSDMAVYINSKNVDPVAGETLARNIATMKKWAAEGK